MLRLSLSHPLLWRTASSVQLGDERAVRLDDVTAWQEQLLDALRQGIPDAMLLPLARTLGASAADAEAFVSRISTALAPIPGVDLPVRAELPADIGFGESQALLQGWRASGLDPQAVTRWRDDRVDPLVPTIVVADRLLDPRRAAALMATDTMHLPIELAGDRVLVGPVVVPGVTACLACRQAHRTDADPQWPLVAAQLIGRERVPTDAGVILEAAVLAGRLLRAAAVGDGGVGVGVGAGTGAATLSVTLSSADVRRVWHAHRPHARCLCRSPEESANADAVAIRNAPTTTATAFARPA